MFSPSTANIVTILTLLAMPVGALAGKDTAMETETITHKYTNKLADETSPYLLQHAHNPVDWYPWSKEAFEIAKKHDKPVFLSIGYSTCHWCHVMERESFENEHIAKIMNEHFVCIKVDREQRPDVDDVYMTAVQMMTGSGGWPLSVFLTPDGKPFYGGTYFPPKDMYGRPGFGNLLLAIADAWKSKRAQLLESAGKISTILQRSDEKPGKETLSPDILKKAYSYLKQNFDSTHGGFGDAPKFPQPSYLSMLLRYWHRTKDSEALTMVETSLDAMAKGGIYDHLGGGFHRYSTDSRWLVPHFEKMLYDQALISNIYVQAYQATDKEDYAKIARDIFDYVLRDMTDPGGGFYSAEDADSEGKEGLFYVWELKEIAKILGKKNARIFNEYYGVTKNGNFEEGRSILNIKISVEELAKQFKQNPKAIESVLTQLRSKLLEHRSKRIRPHLDDKVIAGWNGLMISALADGGAALGEKKYISAAEKAAAFVLTTLRHDDRLMRYYRDGKVIQPGFLDDYAFMIMALLDLYEATFDARRLAEAKELAEQMMELFGDQNAGGFYLTGSDTERLIVRTKPGYDGAVPSGNSVAALVLLKLGLLTSDKRFTEGAEEVLNAFSSQLRESPASLSEMLSALDFSVGPTREIVIAADAHQSDTKEMLRFIQNKFLPNTVLLFHETGKAGEAIEKIAPFVKWQTAINGKATAYVCQNYVCKQPVNEINALKKLLLNPKENSKDN
ncbi:MAG: thioredoxin domain-containing protein [Planctomycetota bacterium]|jgi:uncharacterized protein YyaL (SSP411 family)